MKKTLVATLAAVLVSSAALPAMAAPRGDGPRKAPPVERLMERFDADGDGAVIIEEIHAQRHGLFNSVDADGSGTLDAEEFGMLRDILRQQRADARAEARKAYWTQRESMRDDMRGWRDGRGPMDADRDGRGDRRAERRDDRGPAMAGRQDDRRDWRKTGPRNTRWDGGRGPGSMAFFDTDRDGMVSLEEFTAFDTKMFERLDRNGNGEIEITDFYRRGANGN
ncbi:EF-hand domain-containing protein [Hoeflea olei]|uniref:EF-hand domain-containing protein n=1 Tax=Hoeflea olei TaxID=1480615 RepID=A0A1C1YYC8_9HYPH|nr:EF-hand domain-containing protein [Hoeflea olei]OCW58419.1 hypothetical protein AWJ14_13945 [Hoeflea olei]